MEKKNQTKTIKYGPKKNAHMIFSFGNSIFNKTEKDQSNLLKDILEFNDLSGPKTEEGMDKKIYIFMKVHIQWTHLLRFIIDSTSKFHVESS